MNPFIKFQKLKLTQKIVFFLGLILFLWGLSGLYQKFNQNQLRDKVLLQRKQQTQSDLKTLNTDNIGAEKKATPALRLARQKNINAFEYARNWIQSKNPKISLMGFRILLFSDFEDDDHRIISYFSSLTHDEQKNIIQSLSFSSKRSLLRFTKMLDQSTDSLVQIYLLSHLYKMTKNSSHLDKMLNMFDINLSQFNAEEKITDLLQNNLSKSDKMRVFHKLHDNLLNILIQLEPKNNFVFNEVVRSLLLKGLTDEIIDYIKLFHKNWVNTEYKILIAKVKKETQIKLIDMALSTCPDYIADLFNNIVINDYDSEVKLKAAISYSYLPKELQKQNYKKMISNIKDKKHQKMVLSKYKNSSQVVFCKPKK